jgi:hypothetical protein
MTTQSPAARDDHRPGASSPDAAADGPTEVDVPNGSDPAAVTVADLPTNGGIRRAHRSRRSASRLVFGRPVFWPLIVLVGVGVALRVLVSIAAWPTMFEWIDAIRFVRLYPTGLFSDFWMPAGYPVFLKAVHLVSNDMGFTIAVQHLLGVVTAVLLYLVARRLGVGQWVSLVPAAVVLLSGDQIYLEHILMGDAFYLFAMVLALYLFVLAVQTPSKRWLLALAGVVSGLACLTRTTALVVPVVMVGWLLLVRVGRWKQTGARVALFGLPVVAVIAGYAALASAVGPYTGLFDMSGYDLYSRVAPFADCSKFTPPAGTQVLCESTPVADRLGPEYYAWDLNDTLRRDFPLTPATSRLIERFAEEAIIHQPGAYLKAVTVDMARYVDPSIVARPGGFGEGHDLVTFSYYDRAMEKSISTVLAKHYSGTTPPSTRWLADLGTGQRVLRVGRVVSLVLITAVVGGVVLGRGRRRAALVAIAAMTFLLFLGPVATFTYDVRYGIPPQAFLGLAGALGLQCVLDAWSRRRRPRPAGGDPGPPAAELVRAAG